MGGFRAKKRDDGWPTRADMLLWSPAEKSIQDSVNMVESAGASIALTDAVILLGKARGRVADHIEGEGNVIKVEQDELRTYLKALAESLSCDSDVEGCVNPNLALAARIQIEIMRLQKLTNEGPYK